MINGVLLPALVTCCETKADLLNMYGATS